MELIIILILIGVINIFINIGLWKKRKKNIGNIEYIILLKNICHPYKGLLVVLLWIMALIIGIYLIIMDPYSYSNYIYVILLILVITEVPKWKTVLGKNGIIVKLNYLEWHKIISYEILSNRGKEYILLKWIDNNKEKEIKICNRNLNDVYSYIRNNKKNKESD
jgi:hypothetical protein